MSKNHELFCQDCGCLMKLRKGKYGEFWGCTGYPQCKNTMSKRDGESILYDVYPELDGYDLALQEDMKWGYDD